MDQGRKTTNPVTVSRMRPQDKERLRKALATRVSEHLGATDHEGNPLESPCLIWQGSRNSEGYATISVNTNVTTFVHRAAFDDKHGPIPADKVLDHICGNGHLGCVQVDHLEIVTPKENSRRARVRKKFEGSGDVTES